jgi:hypothetical protein
VLVCLSSYSAFALEKFFRRVRSASIGAGQFTRYRGVKFGQNIGPLLTRGFLQGPNIPTTSRANRIIGADNFAWLPKYLSFENVVGQSGGQ